MAKDTLKLKIEGDVSLSDFQTVVDSFVQLVSLLSTESNPNVVIDWVVSELDTGSAVLATRGTGDTKAARETIIAVVDTYGRLGKASMHGQLDEYSLPVQECIHRLTSVVNGRIPSVSFVSDDSEWKIDTAIEPATEAVGPESRMRIQAFVRTSVRGLVVTLDRKQSLYFTLQDTHTGVNFRCYPGIERIRAMGAMWGRYVTVEGTHNRMSEVPTITEITEIVVHEEQDAGAWRDAIGCAPRHPHGSTDDPQTAVRKIRDG